MGGYYGAPIIVVFKSVRSREDADKKILEVLPSLEKLVASF
jgi:hypothetical protein